MRKQIEEHKAARLRQLQQEEYHPKPSYVLEAEQVIAKHRESELEKANKKARAQLPIPADDACPDCFVERGVTSQMKPIPASEDAPEIDLVKCKECSLVIEIKP